MVTPTRKCDSVFYNSLSVYEDHNNECHMTKSEQYSKWHFGGISSQCLTISPYIWN